MTRCQNLKLVKIIITTQLVLASPFLWAEDNLSTAKDLENPDKEAKTALSGKNDECNKYNKLLSRAEPVLIPTSVCDTISPSLFGLRESLAEHGFGFSGYIQPRFTYDLKDQRESTQSYNGQDPTYTGAFEAKITYDLTRLGMGGNAQLIAGIQGQASSYKVANPPFFSVTTLAVNQSFKNGQVGLQYGYYDLIRSYYGMVLGGDSASAALGPTSVIPSQLGLSLFTPTPAITVALKDSTLTWYNRASISRSSSPNGFKYDISQNPSGLEFKVKGSGTVFVDEIGYKTPLMAPGKSVWFRAGGIYNTSNVDNFETGAKSSDNYGGYGAMTLQLTKPNPMSPKGLYIDTKYDYAPSDRNLFTKNFQMTAFYISPFENRPRDMISLGYSKVTYSKEMVANLAKLGVEAEKDSTAYSLSYAAKLTRGISLISGLTYQIAPTLTPKKDDALILQTMLHLSF